MENNLFESILNSLPFGAYVVDTETFEVLFVNKHIKESLADSNSKYCWEKIFGQKTMCSWCTMNESNNSTNDISYEFFDEHRDKWFLFNEENLQFFNGRKLKYHILVDVSEQKEDQGKIINSHVKISMYSKSLKKSNLELNETKQLLKNKTEELEKMNMTLESKIQIQLQKLRKQDQLLFLYQKQKSLNDMMSIISHQWKQPLHELSVNNIYLYSKNNDKTLDKIYDDNEEIVQFLSSTINVFSNFYNLSNESEFFIKESLNNTILMLTSKLKQLNINIDDKTNNFKITGERNLFSQVILTIFENSISILEERKIIEPRIILDTILDKNKLFISIEDNGGGILNDNLPYIFKNSKSFRENKSSGLGLYIAKLIIVEKFNGNIAAQNTDLGAKFLIEIPYK